MSVFAKSKKASSRGQIAIERVQDGILVLPHHHYRAIIEVSPLNFELKSETEQDAIIDTYESFLNSVGIPLQILIRTREIDMDNYLVELSERLAGETLQIYRDQLGHYTHFIRSLIHNNKILTRHFYIIVPYTATGKTDMTLVKEQLDLTVDIVCKGVRRLGMRGRHLSSLETLDLFYRFYNPYAAKVQPLTERALTLIHSALVERMAEKKEGS